MMQSLTTRWRNAESRKPERLITGPGLVTRNQAFSRVPWGAGAGLRMEAHRSKHVPGALHRSESKLLGRDGCNSCLPPSFTCLAAIDLQVSICTLFLLGELLASQTRWKTLGLKFSSCLTFKPYSILHTYNYEINIQYCSVCKYKSCEDLKTQEEGLVF